MAADAPQKSAADLAADEQMMRAIDAGPGDPLGPPRASGSFKRLLLVSAGIVLVAAGAGYLAAHLSGFLARAGPAQAAAESPKPETETAPGAPEAKPEAKPEGEKGNSKAKEFAYYDFEPVIANLDEPRLARYVRVAVTLAIRADNLAAAGPVLEKKKPQLKHWLTVYFSSCKLDDVRGATNLNRIQREILDALNDQLWPGQKPLIDQVLFKEFAVS